MLRDDLLVMMAALALMIKITGSCQHRGDHDVERQTALARTFEHFHFGHRAFPALPALPSRLADFAFACFFFGFQVRDDGLAGSGQLPD